MQPAIETSSVSKRFRVAKARHGFWSTVRGLLANEGRDVVAVDNISFAIDEGSFVGYLGPNGAGKSTTIKMMTGILHPTAGEIRVAGLSPQHRRKEVARKIGVVFGQRTQLWWDLPVRDSYELLAAMYRVSRPDLERALRTFDETLGIGAFLDVPVRKLSLGQRMRADLAAALLHRPPIVFLDEPTIGLDVVAKAGIRRFLQEINQRDGVTVLLTTHDMDDIEQLCSRVLVINHGRLVYDGGIDHLRTSVGAPTVITVEYATPPESSPTGPWTIVKREGAVIAVAFDRTACAAGEVISRLAHYGELRDVHMSEPDIESVIERIYTGRAFADAKGPITG